MESYERLSLKDRIQLQMLLALGKGCRGIARVLCRSASTIWRELHRAGATPGTYCAAAASEDAAAAAHRPRRPLKLEAHRALWEYVTAGLLRHWSPEQIAHRMRKENPTDKKMHISHETIYRYLFVLPRGELKKMLVACLRRRRGTRKPRGRVPDGRGRIPDMVSIDLRPPEVADRKVPGHWEGDLIVGGRHSSAVGTLVERTSRATILVPLKGCDARSVRRAFAREMSHAPRHLARSLTYDQGKEMQQHRLFTEETQIQVYFAHPHSPWERGTNENTNGLVRDFFPKGTDFSKVSKRRIKDVQALLNGRPRRVLDWRTPAEVFLDQIVPLAT